MNSEVQNIDEESSLRSMSDVIMLRRTINRYVPDSAPGRDVIIRALEHASFAPNHYLTEPWHFYLLGPKTIKQICDLNADMVREYKGEKAAAATAKLWNHVPGWMVMTTPLADDPIQEIEDYASCCCAAQNMMLYLWNEGVGMKWGTGRVTRDERFLPIIGADPEREKPVGMFWYGAPAAIPKTKRKSADEFVTDRP